MKNKRLRRKITVSAPGKLMLFGEHAVVFNRPCIVTAVDQRIFATLEKTGSPDIEISAPEVGVKNYSISVKNVIGEKDVNNFPKDVRFVLTAIKTFFEKYNLSFGLNIVIKSEFSSLYGFGSSSAVTVCMVKGLVEIADIEVSRKSLFDTCYRIVLGVQGVGSGFDLAAAIWGGTIYFVTGGRKITPLNIKLPLLIIGYSGVKADTSTLIRKVAGLKKNKPEKVEKILNSIETIVNDAKDSLNRSDFHSLGKLATKNQKLLYALGVSTKKLDSMISGVEHAGAYGSKLSGAGGGDCIIAFSDESKKEAAENAIEKAGGKVLDVKTNAEGVRIENI